MAEERPRFLDRGKECTFSAHTKLWDSGQDPMVCYVLQGEVTYSFGEEKAVTCSKGMLFGVVDVYAPADEVIFRAEAVSEVTVYCWTREQFDLALGIYQELARETIQTLSKRLRLVNDLLRKRNLA